MSQLFGVRVSERLSIEGEPVLRLSLGSAVVLWLYREEVVAFASKGRGGWRRREEELPQIADVLQTIPAFPMSRGNFELRLAEVQGWVEELGETVALMLQRGTLR